MKDTEALERIKYLCPPEGYYVAYSGGKDSTVILDLIRRSGVPYDAHYNLNSRPSRTRPVRPNSKRCDHRTPQDLHVAGDYR